MTLNGYFETGMLIGLFMAFLIWPVSIVILHLRKVK